MQRIIGFLLGLLTVATIVGCGGGNKTTRAGTGRATLTVQWPKRPAGRLIPEQAESVVVRTYKDATATTASNKLAETTISRGTAANDTVPFNNLPVGTVYFTATATGPGGPSNILATNDPNDKPNDKTGSVVQSVEIFSGGNTPFTVMMGTIVDHIDINPPGNVDTKFQATPVMLTATPKDANGNTVLNLGGNLNWSQTPVPPSKTLVLSATTGNSISVGTDPLGTSEIKVTYKEGGEIIKFATKIVAVNAPLFGAPGKTLGLDGDCNGKPGDFTNVLVRGVVTGSDYYGYLSYVDAAAQKWFTQNAVSNRISVQDLSGSATVSVADFAVDPQKHVYILAGSALYAGYNNQSGSHNPNWPDTLADEEGRYKVDLPNGEIGSRVSVGADGRVYVVTINSDVTKNHVVRYSFSGAVDISWPRSTFNNPTQITADQGGNIYAITVSGGTGTVTRFTVTGPTVTADASFQQTPLTGASYVAVGANGLVYATGSGGAYVLSQTGSIVAQDNNPFQAVDQSGNFLRVAAYQQGDADPIHDGCIDNDPTTSTGGTVTVYRVHLQ